MFKDKGNYISLNNNDLSRKIDIIKNQSIKNKRNKKYQLIPRRKKCFKKLLKFVFITLIFFLISMILFVFIFKRNTQNENKQILNTQLHEKEEIMHKNNTISSNSTEK